MKITKFTLMTLMSGVVAVTLSGAALADSGTITTTGPGSQNDVQLTNKNEVTINNQNDIQVTNSNYQSAKTGSASVSGNTTAGDAMSGAATNNNNVMTLIGISPTKVPTGGQGGGSGAGSTSGSTNGSAANNSRATTKVTAGKGGGLLPKTGATVPVNVSALRALYHPASVPSETAAVAQAKSLSTVMLAIAAGLSLLGAIGSAAYSNKRTLKV